MLRSAFVSTPFVHVGVADLEVKAYTASGGDRSVVLQLGPDLRMHVYDPDLLARLAEMVAEAQDLLTAAVTGQDRLPVESTAAVA